MWNGNTFCFNLLSVIIFLSFPPPSLFPSLLYHISLVLLFTFVLSLLSPVSPSKFLPLPLLSLLDLFLGPLPFVFLPLPYLSLLSPAFPSPPLFPLLVPSIPPSLPPFLTPSTFSLPFLAVLPPTCISPSLLPPFLLPPPFSFSHLPTFPLSPSFLPHSLHSSLPLFLSPPSH